LGSTLGYADIVNLTTGEIFEIKSRNEEEAGNLQLGGYITNARNLCLMPPSWQRGNSIFPVGESNAIKRSLTFNGQKYKLSFWMSPNYSGVVLYNLETTSAFEELVEFYTMFDAIDALKLLLAASMVDMRRIIAAPSEIETIKNKIINDVNLAIKRLNTPVIQQLVLVCGCAGFFSLASTLIPANQMNGILATMFMGVIGVAAYNEIENRNIN
jgi:hypothetical protein